MRLVAATTAHALAAAALLCGGAAGAAGELLVEEILLPESQHLLERRFGAWEREHRFALNESGLEVAASGAERARQMAVWRANEALVAEHNARGESWQMAMNQFAALTTEEFAQQFLMQAPQPGCSATAAREGWSFSGSANDIPSSVDWRDKGILSPVKNQGKCGSCWTFSTTGAVESHLKLYHGQELLLSEQQLVDCAGAFDTHGCNGGLPSHAFEYIKYNHGIETEAEYPYKGKTGTTCRFDAAAPVKGLVKDSANITAYDENALTAAIATKGPVSIAFHVANGFQLYSGGVYANARCPDKPSSVNHAVLAVGYGVQDAHNILPYYIVKNSWGPRWGLQGYFKIQRGANTCGLSVCNSFPIV